MLAVALAGAVTVLAVPSTPAAPSMSGDHGRDGWHVVSQTTVSDAVAGEGVATVRAPGQPMRVYYTDGATIPAAILAQGWGHVGDPDSWHGYIVDPYQQVVTTPTEKMFMVTTPDGRQYEYTHQITGDEQPVNANAYAAVTPDGRWVVSSELAPVTRLLVFPAPLLNPSTPRTGGDLPVASRILLDHMVRNPQGCDFVTATRLICASDDSNNDIYPTSKPLVQIDLAHPLHGKDVTAHVRSLGQVPLSSTCVGAYTVEGVDYDTVTGDLRVEVVPPSPCNTNVTVYVLRHSDA
jgi:hypothetical protein